MEGLGTLAYIALGGILLGVAAKVALKLTSPRVTGVRRVACLGDSLTAEGVYCTEMGRLLPGSSVRYWGYPGKGAGFIRGKLDKALEWNPTDLVVLAGVNDLPKSGGAGTAAANLAKIYGEARAQGVRVIAVTLLPWHGYPSASGKEQSTYNLNAWISNDAVVDAVVDTSVLGDASYKLLPVYDAGDGLHLNKAGQKALGFLIVDQAF